MSSKNIALLERIARESLWGRRGIIKANSLWLPLALILSKRIPQEKDSILGLGIQIYLVVCCWILVSTWANDLSECSQDLAAGKQRWICSLPYPLNWGVIIVLSVLGLVICVLAKSPVGTRWGYEGAIILGLSYSLKPFRLKERGLWGLLTYSAACLLAYVAVPWTWLKPPLLLIIVLSPLVFLDKWVNLQLHQVLDHETDSRKGMQTHAVRVGIENARLSLRRWAAAAELAFLGFWVCSIFLLPRWRAFLVIITAGTAAASGTYIFLARKGHFRPNSLLREVPWPYLSLNLAILRVFPLILLILLAAQRPAFWGLVALAIPLIIIESLSSLRYRLD